MSDTYGSFAELAAVQREEVDFKVRSRVGRTNVLFTAPHGGGIEPFTAPLAKALAGAEHGYYCFCGTKGDGGNWCLHITSTRFDEPRALDAVAIATHVIAIHGAAERDGRWVMVGGRDEVLATALRVSLQDSGFEVRPCDHRNARSPNNICNKNRRGAGVQLELSAALRDYLRSNVRVRRRFVNAVRAPVPMQRTNGA